MSLFDILDRENEKVTTPEGSILDIGKAARKFWSKLPDVPGTKRCDVLHCSGVFYICPREFVLNYWKPSPRPLFDLSGQLIVDAGTMVHDTIQNFALGPLGVLKGDWVRREDGVGEVLEEVKDSYHPDPKYAINEIKEKGVWFKKRPTWQYREYEVWSDKYRFTGRMDGIIGNQRLQVALRQLNRRKVDAFDIAKEVLKIKETEETEKLLEIKTAGAWAKDSLQSNGVPPQYQCQASMYQHLSGKSSTLFLYVDRDTMKFESTFEYKKDQGWVDEIIRKATIIWESIRDRVLPDSMMACKSPTDVRAKKCPFSEPCFMYLPTSSGKRTADFQAWVTKGIISQQSTRTFLDLSEWVA